MGPRKTHKKHQTPIMIMSRTMLAVCGFLMAHSASGMKPNRQCDTDGCNGSVTVGASCDHCIVSKEVPLTWEKIHNLLVSNIKAKLSCHGLVKELTKPKRENDEINAFLNAIAAKGMFASIPKDVVELARNQLQQHYGVTPDDWSQL